MDYDAVIESTYKWALHGKAKIYLLFFFIMFLLIFVLGRMVEIFWGQFYFSYETEAIFSDIFYVAQALVFAGMVCLIRVSLKNSGFQTVKISVFKIVDVFFLQILELWYLLVWNLEKRYRVIQLLSLMGILLTSYTASVVRSELLTYSLIFLSIIYFLCVLYNSIRLLFPTLILINKGIKINDAILESWRLTYQREKEIFVALVFVLLFLFVFCAIASFFASAVANVVLLFFGLHTILGSSPNADLELARHIGAAFGVSVFIVGYWFAISKIYLQVVKHHDSSTRIKRILAWRVLYPKKAGHRRIKRKSGKAKGFGKKRRR
jgi:hypothetical protein